MLTMFTITEINTHFTGKPSATRPVIKRVTPEHALGLFRQSYGRTADLTSDARQSQDALDLALLTYLAREISQQEYFECRESIEKARVAAIAEAEEDRRSELATARERSRSATSDDVIQYETAADESSFQASPNQPKETACPTAVPVSQFERL